MLVTCYPVFLYHGYMLPSVSLLWLHVTQCFFIMGTCGQVFLLLSHYSYLLIAFFSYA